MTRAFALLLLNQRKIGKYEVMKKHEVWLSRIKNNAVTAALIALGTIIIALSTFTDAAKNLFEFLPEKNVNVTGTWETEILTNPFAERNQFRLYFDVEVRGDILVGTIREVSTTSHYDIKMGILGGQIQDNNLSFYNLRQSVSGDGETTTFKNLYYGTVHNGEIQFILQSDRPWGFPPQKFVARQK